MSAIRLLSYICAALSLQLALAIGIAIWSWRREAAESQIAVGEPIGVAGTAPWSGSRGFRVVDRAFEDRDHTQCSFRLGPIDGVALPPFKPGQFVTVAIRASGGSADQERSILRCYSLSDRPDPALSTVLVAGGVGITPMISILWSMLADLPARSVHLFLGVRHGGEHAFKPSLEALARSHPGFHMTVAYSRPSLGDALERDYQHAGHVDIELIRRTLPAGRHRFYVCGPPAMMASVVPALLAWGVGRDDIRVEAFGPAAMRAAEDAPASSVGREVAPVAVRFRRSGRTRAWTGPDDCLLDLAERSGIATDCFACHAPLRGAASDRCIACHRVPDIGLRTTKGTLLPHSVAKPQFHQSLIEQDCVACHSDHEGPQRAGRGRRSFSHALLPQAAMQGCASCHVAPANALHRNAGASCSQCHLPERWTPSTFDHARHFVLDRDHDVACATCHVGADFSRYTCYGCHEHRSDKIGAKHRKEGIGDFGDCVACHRSAHEEPKRRNPRAKRERD